MHLVTEGQIWDVDAYCTVRYRALARSERKDYTQLRIEKLPPLKEERYVPDLLKRGGRRRRRERESVCVYVCVREM